MTKQAFFVVLLLVVMFVLVPGVGAESPTYHYALVQCSGLDLQQLATAQQRFDTAYGFAHQLTTQAQWVNTYEARANEFAVSLGCQPVLRDGQLTFYVKIYAPVYRFYLDAMQ